MSSLDKYVFSKYYVKRAKKTGNSFCNIAAKRVKKRCSTFYYPRSNLSCKKPETSDWIKLRGSHADPVVTSLAAKQVCLGLVKRATCIDFDAKSNTTLYLFYLFFQQLFAT